MWNWITSSRTNKIIAATTAFLCLLALVSAVGAWHFRGRMQEAKKAEKIQQDRADTLEREGAAKDEAFRKALGATDGPLKNALSGVREAKTALERAEDARRDLWIPPAVDNGDLVARFEKAIGELR